jgi:hypothetical protein
MEKKKINRNNLDFPIHQNSSQSITFGLPVFFGTKGSSYIPIFPLSVIFLTGIQH